VTRDISLEKPKVLERRKQDERVNQTLAKPENEKEISAAENVALIQPSSGCCSERVFAMATNLFDGEGHILEPLVRVLYRSSTPPHSD
jgi:hypothetical protein